MKIFIVLIFSLIISSISHANLVHPTTIKGTLIKIEGNMVHLDQGNGRVIEVPKKFIKDPLVPRAMIYVKVKNDKELAQIKQVKKN